MLLALSSVVTAALVLAATALAAFAAYTYWRSRLGPQPPGVDMLRCTVTQVREGGVVRLCKFGDDGEDVELPIARRTRVRLGTEEWHELTGPYRDRTLYLEVFGQVPKVRVSAFRRSDLPLETVGVDPAVLEAARTRDTPVPTREGTLTVEQAGEAVREGPAAPAAPAVRTWVLHDVEKRRVVRVERSGDQPPRAREGVYIAADAIEVVRLHG